MNAKTVRRIITMLGLVMLLAVSLAACVNTDKVPEYMDNDYAEQQKNESDTSETSDSSEDVVSTPEGATASPTNISVTNITPRTVAISGNCAEGAVVTVEGGVETVSAKSRDGYFIIKAEIPDDYNVKQLDVIAQVEGLEASLPTTVLANFNATAQDRLDGNSVTVGLDSRLYFEKMIDDLAGKNIYTTTQLATIRSQISSDYKAYVKEAGENDVDMIYVLVPNVTSLYGNEIIPEDTYKEPFTTIYQQVKDTLVNGTTATVIDMKEVFGAMISEESLEYPIYRVTDSALSDYGAYLTYKEIMNVVSSDERFTAAAPRAMDEFDWKAVETLGGNLVKYRELDPEIITETTHIAVPKFDMSIGSSIKLSSLRKFLDEEDGDYNYCTGTSDEYNGVAERLTLDNGTVTTNAETGKTETVYREGFPTAVIYRDDATLGLTDILAERFNKTLFTASGTLRVKLGDASKVAAPGKARADYIIVILSEDSMDTAFASILN